MNDFRELNLIPGTISNITIPTVTGHERLLQMTKKALMAIGAHADDIEFNVASTLLKYMETGYDIVYVQSTNNMSGRWSRIKPDGTRENRTLPWHQLMPQRKLEAAKAARELFNTEPIHLNHPQRHYTDDDCRTVDLCYGSPCPDCIQPATPTIMTAFEHKQSVDQLAELIMEKDAEAILTHAPIDGNPEHTCTNLLVYKAFLEARKQGYRGSLLFWLEVTATERGETFNLWNSFINTDGYFQRKFQAIGIHASQVPKPETLELEDEIRGRLCGCESAEVFNVCRIGEDCSGKFIQEIKNNLYHYRYGK
jgi:LmbE family N-acetylglucosaminyl deacetylase